MRSIRDATAVAAVLIIATLAATLVYAAITRQANVGIEVVPSSVSGDIFIDNEDLALGEVVQGDSASGSFDMTNPGDVPVTGITIQSLGDSDIEFVFVCAGGCDTLAAGATKTVGVQANVAEDAALGSRLIPLEIGAP